MSLKSMHETSRQIRRERKGIPDGMCLPLSIDAGLKNHSLPREWYDYFLNAYQGGHGWNDTVGHFLQNFYNVEPWPETKFADIAQFNRFGQSRQVYTPPVEIDSDSTNVFEGDKKSGELLLRTLAVTARTGCLVLFNVQTPRGEHTKLLDCVDPYSPYGTMYLVRDWGVIQPSNDQKVYSSSELTGRVHPPFTIRDHNAPLPEVSRRAFPVGQTSWELAIFPPEEYIS